MYDTITWIAFFASVFGMYYVYLIIRNKERMALIEKGADAGLFYSEKEIQTFNWSKLILKIGMLLMGIALGLTAGILITQLVKAGRHLETPIYFSAIFFFGGLSLILSYVIDRKNK
jgi:hypothetical protein